MPDSQQAPSMSREELDRVMSTLSHISSDLVESYHELARKADRVENELERTNAQLVERVAELESILQALPTGVVVRDNDGRVLRANDAALGILGQDVAELFCSDSMPSLAPSDEPVEYLRPDGTRAVIDSRVSSIRTPLGKEFGSVEILDDRTELTRLHERIHRMDKMAALGTMAAGVAHEIRNPMNAIKGFADLLLRQVDAKDDESKESRWASNISRGVSEIDTIIRSMLTFADPEPLHSEVVDSEELVQSAIEAATIHLEQDLWNIEVECYAAEFVGDRIKLRQAVRNLISNAIDAMPEGGTIRVELFVDGDQVCVRVSDNGPGISPGDAKRLTDPFFTTRAEGTGLGLTLVHTIAEVHGGRLHVSPEPSALGGAHFSIRIPFVPSHCR